MVDKLSNILTNNRKLSVLSALTLLILMILFSKSPIIDSSLSGYNIDNNPYDSIGQRMASLFGSKNMIQVLVKPEPGSSRNIFSGLDEAEEEIQNAFPGIRVESLTSARRLLQGRGDQEKPVKEMLTEALEIPVAGDLVPLGFLIIIFVIFKIDMNITTSITLVTCLGLIVDDTIQILYRRVRLTEPLEELGFGVLTTSLILTGGFLSFVLSQSRPIQVFGLLCAIVFLIAVISDMTIMPWILKEK